MKKTHWIITAIGILVLLALSCSDDSIPSSIDGQNNGNVIGSVTESDTGEGIEGALLVLTRNSSKAETFSDIDGVFEFKNIESDQYTISIKLPAGYNISGEKEQTVTIDGDIQISFEGEPVRQTTKTIQPGETDTLSTSSGSVVRVDATQSTSNFEISLEEVEGGFDEHELLYQPTRIRIQPAGSKSNTEIHSGNDNINITLSQLYDGNAGGIMKVLKTKNIDDDEYQYFYSSAEIKALPDPSTGRDRNVITHEIQVSEHLAMEFTISSIFKDDNCDNNFRSLKEIPNALDGNKPLILIHGLQFSKSKCTEFDDFQPELDTFSSLIPELMNRDDIRNEYKLFVYKYTSNTSVLENSRALLDLMLEKNIERPVLIAHSMGGLVARGLIAETGEDSITGLITLGTPHYGSPLASLAMNIEDKRNAANRICNSIPGSVTCNTLNLMISLSSWIFPISKGFEDLEPESNLISDFKNHNYSKGKVFSVGGRIDNVNDIGIFEYILGYRYMDEVLNVDNDGMVLLPDAIPNWSGGRHVLNHHDHSDVKDGLNGDPNTVVDVIEPILLNFAGVQLTINIEGEGSIEQVVQQNKIVYEYGTVVELTANPAEGWRFEGWHGDISSESNPVQITLNKNKEIKAVFRR